MITLRLFKAADPFRQIGSRTLERGEMTIGRDSAADWTLADARGDLSRRHCVVGLEGERLWLHDTSSNGVFLGVGKRPAPRGKVYNVTAGETLYLGEYMIVLDPDPADDDGGHSIPFAASAHAPAFTEAPAAKDGQAAPSHITDAGMLEAFCRGAGLEASSFAGEDPSELMARLGVVYRRVVDDLCGLMRDRALLKNSLKLDHTTISARDNNPLKWAPPQRVAVDLLREGETGFLKGAAAFEASFSDLRRHGACLLAGSRTAVEVVLEELKPEQLETGVRKQPLDFLSKYEPAWKQLQKRHAELSADSDARSGRIESAFREGYEAELRVLDAREDAA